MGAPKHANVVHINSLKLFRDYSVKRLDVVVEDESDKGCKLSRVCDGFVKEDLDVLLHEFEGVFSDVPGNTSVVTMGIDTGDAVPIRQTSYSVPLGLRDKVKGVADFLSRCFGAEEDEKDLEQTSSSEVVTHLSKQGGNVGVERHPHIFKN